MNKYGIANTTKEQREKFVADAEAINLLGAEPLTKENRDLLHSTIDMLNQSASAIKNNCRSPGAFH